MCGNELIKKERMYELLEDDEVQNVTLSACNQGVWGIIYYKLCVHLKTKIGYSATRL